MQQKKIIFSLLSLIGSATFSMEKNSNPTAIPNDYIKCGQAFIPKMFLNDVVLMNIRYDYSTNSVFLKPMKWQEKKDRLSVLPGFSKTRENAEWQRGSDGKEVRYVLSNDTENFLKILNESIYSSVKK